MRRFDKYLVALLVLVILGAFIVSDRLQKTHGQITQPATTGMVAPMASGSGAPSTVLICNAASANLGYYEISTNQVWVCENNTWTLVIGQIGPTGATGSVGSTGATGPTGTAGATGATGPAGTNATSYLKGTTGVITGTLLAVGGTDSGTATITGSVTGTPCIASTTDGTNPSSSVVIGCTVTATNTATVTLTAYVISTPASKSYNVRVYP